MIIHLFSLKLEDVELKLQDANFQVSSPINQVEVKELVLGKLRQLNLTTDFKAIEYLIKDGSIYAEGKAHDIPKAEVGSVLY